MRWPLIISSALLSACLGTQSLSHSPSDVSTCLSIVVPPTVLEKTSVAYKDVVATELPKCLMDRFKWDPHAAVAIRDSLVAAILAMDDSVAKAAQRLEDSLKTALAKRSDSLSHVADSIARARMAAADLQAVQDEYVERMTNGQPAWIGDDSTMTYYAFDEACRSLAHIPEVRRVQYLTIEEVESSGYRRTTDPTCTWRNMTTTLAKRLTHQRKVEDCDEKVRDQLLTREQCDTN